MSCTLNIMLRNVTLSAEVTLIARARDKAAARQSSLNVEFRKWLVSFTAEQDTEAVDHFRGVMAKLGHVEAGRTFTRDEMNQR